MKKTWIKIKRGLLEPKHRDKLGIRIWLYIYILDQTDWETGKIFEWRDKEAAEDLQMNWRTLQQQRQQLAEDDYISCIQSGNKQVITINNWTSPREYSGDIYNPTGRGTRINVPTDRGTDSHVSAEGTIEGTYKGISKPSTLPIRSHITYQGTWEDFKEHRKQIKKPMTPLAETRLLNKLSKYSVEVAIEMLDRSIENGWQGVFELNGRDRDKVAPTKNKFVEWS